MALARLAKFKGLKDRAASVTAFPRTEHSHDVACTPPAPERSGASLSSYYYPFFEAGRHAILSRASEAPLKGEDGLPIPPDSLRSGYGSDDRAYLASGRENFRRMMEIVGQSGLVLGDRDRILDFGCSSGRMIRCFKEMASRCEVWGADISAEHILWCQEYLSPPFRFTTTTTYPHLPFEDNSFGLIYAGSVFTHIGDLEDAWLVELRRILRPGGRLYATVHDNHTIQVLASSPPGHWLHDWYLRTMMMDLESKYHPIRDGFRMFTINVKPGSSQVFHDRDYLRKRWGQWLNVMSFHEEAYGYQTAVLMSK